jgi:hypothetical protein
MHYSGQPTWAEGNPAIDTTRTAAELAAEMKIDWPAIIYGDAMAPDITVPSQPFPSLAWFEADTSRWPIIRITSQNYSLPNKGRGVLIVEGNFTISGSDMWDGIIMVGGKLTSNGNNTVAGATISGLNVLLPGNPQASTSEFDDATANGNKTYVYSSCKVARATKSLQSYRVLANTWADNLPSW